jgi:hypothetical protein
MSVISFQEKAGEQSSSNTNNGNNPAASVNQLKKQSMSANNALNERQVTTKLRERLKIDESYNTLIDI